MTIVWDKPTLLENPSVTTPVRRALKVRKKENPAYSINRRQLRGPKSRPRGGKDRPHSYFSSFPVENSTSWARHLPTLGTVVPWIHWWRISFGETRYMIGPEQTLSGNRTTCHMKLSCIETKSLNRTYYGAKQAAADRIKLSSSASVIGGPVRALSLIDRCPNTFLSNTT